MLKRLLIAQGISLILIFNILSFPVSASEEKRVDLNFQVNNTVDLNSEESKKNSTINTSDYTIHITDKVEFTNNDINKGVSKQVDIVVDLGEYTNENIEVKISNKNTFLLAREDKNTISYSVYKESNNINKLNVNDKLGTTNLNASNWLVRALIFFINLIFGIDLKYGEYTKCYVAIDKNTVHSSGNYNGNLTFEFQAK